MPETLQSLLGELDSLIDQGSKDYSVSADQLAELDAAFADVDLGNAAKCRRRRQRKVNGEEYVAPDPMSAEEKLAKRRERQRAKRREREQEKIDNIAVLDFETDPFDGETRERISPFTVCIYSEHFEPVVFWDDDEEKFIERLLIELENLPGTYTIYAHNGGKFDFMFLIHKLRGPVMFKGRGIMCANVGRHELRDSMHLIPEKLASYRKEEFSYDKMKKGERHKHKKTITEYMISDCVYLYDIVKSFLQTYGFRISIGQASMMLLKESYPECENIREKTDDFMRKFFFGGRVQCLQGAGVFEGEYELDDVNSMYPDVMANEEHPIGAKFMPRTGRPGPATCFVDVTCYSDGAFPVHVENEGTQFPKAYGRYKVSIFEYNVAKKYNLIKREKINYVVDNAKRTKFDKFIIPLYDGRLHGTKPKLKQMKKDGNDTSKEFFDVKKDDMFLKFLLNNGYGKFAQNPRRFKEHYLTDPDEAPPDPDWGDKPDVCNDQYAIWSRRAPHKRFNNVGTAASITGAARAKLLEAICNAVEPIYCDTDSLICKGIRNTEFSDTVLGAWDREAEMTKVVIAGKKLYAYSGPKIKHSVVKTKGTKGLTMADIEKLVEGETILVKAHAPTLTKNGKQDYIDRMVRSTAKPKGS